MYNHMYHDHDMLEPPPGPFWLLYACLLRKGSLSTSQHLNNLHRGTAGWEEDARHHQVPQGWGNMWEILHLNWLRVSGVVFRKPLVTSGFAGPSNTMANLPLDAWAPERAGHLLP